MMLPFKQILCPTDFSEPSYRALRKGTEIASHFHADLIVMHVLEPIPMMYAAHGPLDFNAAEFENENRRYAKKKIDEILENTNPGGISMTGEIKIGAAADEIIAAASKAAVDLIVMATHGLTGWRRFVIGSVAEKVVRNAFCPVLTIQVSSQE